MLMNIFLVLVVTLVIVVFAISCYRLGYQEGLSAGLDLMHKAVIEPNEQMLNERGE